jgi:peptidoglycan/LPS O-acetylase OafA/YrhL
VEAGSATPAGPNFNALRIFAVLVVIYGNGFVLTNSLAPGLWGEPFARVGLHLLFAISGYILAVDWRTDPHWARYAARRVLRLFPGLVAAVLLTVMVIAPLATGLAIPKYFINGQTLSYLGNMILIHKDTLPRVFEGQAWGGLVNPMLWVLQAALLLAAMVPMVHRLPAGRRILLLAAMALLTGSVAFHLTTVQPGHAWYPLRSKLEPTLPEIPYFLMGMAWAAIAGHATWGRLLRADLAIMAFLLNWFVASWWSDWTSPLLWITVPYMVACFGQGRIPLLDQLPPIAFGMYLIAFPVQQLVAGRLPGMEHPIVAATLLSAAVGVASWRWVERPALALGWAGLAARLLPACLGYRPTPRTEALPPQPR